MTDTPPALRETPHPAGAPALFDRTQRLLLLAVIALLAVLRLPRAWMQGRFLGEEGSVFMAYAWHRPPLDALFRSFAGYLNLAANGATLLVVGLVRGGLVPLERAPYVTMGLALAAQLVPAALLLFGRAPWLTKRWAVVACLLFLVVLPRTEEVFANVLHIQFHLALAAALVLALDVPQRRAARIAYGAILLLAPLCGPAAIVLLPLFGLRAALERDRGRLLQGAVLAVGGALQLGLFFSASPVRGALRGPVTLAAMLFVRLIVLPLSRPAVANHVGEWLVASPALLWLAAALGAVAFAALLVLALRRRDAAAWLLVSALALAGISFGGGMIASDRADLFSASFGERYNFLPLTLLGLALAALAARSEGRGRGALAALCGIAIVAGLIAFPKPVAELARGPSWSAEVARWRVDHNHLLVAWPDGWTVDLSDRDRPCGSPGRARAWAEPAYCEGAWLVRVAARVPNTRARPGAPPSAAPGPVR